jgi:hypothetical protein
MICSMLVLGARAQIRDWDTQRTKNSWSGGEQPTA